jgi:hypothetical protein
MDLTTLAALLGHNKLTMVMRYAHPQEQHQADAVKQLELTNAAKEIAEVEKGRARERLGTKTGTIAENPANFSEEKIEGNSHQIN